VYSNISRFYLWHRLQYVLGKNNPRRQSVSSGVLTFKEIFMKKFFMTALVVLASASSAFAGGGTVESDSMKPLATKINWKSGDIENIENPVINIILTAGRDSTLLNIIGTNLKSGTYSGYYFSSLAKDAHRIAGKLCREANLSFLSMKTTDIGVAMMRDSALVPLFNPDISVSVYFASELKKAEIVIIDAVSCSSHTAATAPAKLNIKQ